MLFIAKNSFATKTLERAGDIIQIILPTFAGLYSVSKRDYTGAKQLLYSGLTSTSLVYELKYIVNAKRPDGGRHSFPSGHTAISFVSSTYMWKRYGPEFGVPSTLLASFVGLSRIEARRHFVHDVVVGALIGIAASCIFTSKYQDNFIPTNNGVGIKIDF